MTIEETIAEIERRGYRVNNLYRSKGENAPWWCNVLSDERGAYDFAKGATAGEALEKALALTRGAPVAVDTGDIFS
jgi:hypothetical protein